jgi:hypothetical protein
VNAGDVDPQISEVGTRYGVEVFVADHLRRGAPENGQIARELCAENKTCD